MLNLLLAILADIEIITKNALIAKSYDAIIIFAVDTNNSMVNQLSTFLFLFEFGQRNVSLFIFDLSLLLLNQRHFMFLLILPLLLSLCLALFFYVAVYQHFFDDFCNLGG